jgi:hypothetical protein
VDSVDNTDSVNCLIPSSAVVEATSAAVVSVVAASIPAALKNRRSPVSQSGLTALTCCAETSAVSTVENNWVLYLERQGQQTRRLKSADYLRPRWFACAESDDGTIAAVLMAFWQAGQSGRAEEPRSERRRSSSWERRVGYSIITWLGRNFNCRGEGEGREMSRAIDRVGASE